jgi:TPR repeat protein
LGVGGMGVVWRARDVELDEPVALKFLPEVVARDDAAVDELKDETRHARRLTHPNIVRIHQFEREGAIAAVSMEFVDGTTLSHLRLQQPGKVFAVETLAPLVAQLCAALDYAHGHAKIVHRDLKPANILITRNAVVKVTDFGIARSLSENSTRITGKGDDSSGTPPYMSPQQVRGRKPKATDDLYALGATLYESLTSMPPFSRGDPYSLRMQILEEEPLSLAERRDELGVEGEPIPSAWEETILACLAKDPENRPQSAGDVARRLGISNSNLSIAAPVTAFDETKAKAERGDVYAQNRLGWMYECGNGVAEDSAEAAKWYRKAADQGNSDAQNFLGLMHECGSGVPKNSAEAVRWYRKAAEQGDADAQFSLGLMYEDGDGVPKDSAEAVKWYRKAADQGDACAQVNLGLMYFNGDGVPKDSAEEVKWYRKAADQGNASAQYNLGEMYANGDGVPKDETEALAWYEIAAASGIDNIVKNRDALELHLGREATLLAQQRSKEILKKIEAAKAR